MNVKNVQDVNKVINHVLQNSTFREIGTDGELDDIANFVTAIFKVMNINVWRARVVDVPSDQVFEVEVSINIINGKEDTITIDMESATETMSNEIWRVAQLYI